VRRGDLLGEERVEPADRRVPRRHGRAQLLLLAPDFRRERRVLGLERAQAADIRAVRSAHEVRQHMDFAEDVANELLRRRGVTEGRPVGAGDFAALHGRAPEGANPCHVGRLVELLDDEVMSPIERLVEELRSTVAPARNRYPLAVELVIGGARCCEVRLDEDLAKLGGRQAGADDRAMQVAGHLPNATAMARRSLENILEMANEDGIGRNRIEARRLATAIKVEFEFPRVEAKHCLHRAARRTRLRRISESTNGRAAANIAHSLLAKRYIPSYITLAVSRKESIVASFGRGFPLCGLRRFDGVLGRKNSGFWRNTMKLSARNQIKGKVVSVQKGQTTGHVKIDIGGGTVVTSSITNEAIDDLALKVGDDAIAVIKASDVMVAK
jgi:molybdopterin-binding protein